MRVAAAAAVLASFCLAALAGDATLSKGANERLAAFRAVPWAERLRPERGDPVPEGWQARVQAEWAFANATGPDAAALLPLLRDDDRFVRALAARSIGIAQPSGSSEALLAALAAEKDKVVRVALIEAIARAGGTGALEAVEALDAGGADKDVVTAIGFARRQLKGGKWDLDSIRGEHAEAPRTKLASAKVDETAPEIALPGADGVVNLSTLRGRMVLLVFAHGDRGGADMKALARLQEPEQFAEWKPHVVVVVPHEKERTRIWADRVKLPFTFAADPSGRAQAAYGVARQLFAGGEWLPSPAWFLLDKEGVIRWRKIGRRMDEQATLGELLPQMEMVWRGIKPF